MSAVSQVLHLCTGNCQVFEPQQWKRHQEEHFDSPLDSVSVNIYSDKHGEALLSISAESNDNPMQCFISPAALFILWHVFLSRTKCPSKYNSLVCLSTQTCASSHFTRGRRERKQTAQFCFLVCAPLSVFAYLSFDPQYHSKLLTMYIHFSRAL